jgi:hypothetical protein
MDRMTPYETKNPRSSYEKRGFRDFLAPPETVQNMLLAETEGFEPSIQ